MRYLKSFAVATLLTCAFALPSALEAQSVAVKTNLLGWATTTTNLGLEFGLSRHSTLEVMGYLNPWDFGVNDRHFHFWAAQPEYR